MDAVAALTRLGGVASTHDLLLLTTRRRLRSAVGRAEIESVGRSRWALAGARGQRRAAAELAATLSHLSAAQQHGWELKAVPEVAWLTVPRNRKVSREVQACRQVVWADLDDGTWSPASPPTCGPSSTAPGGSRSTRR